MKNQPEHFIPKTLPEALRALANGVEMRRLIERQRDEAIKMLTRVNGKTGA